MNKEEDRGRRLFEDLDRVIKSFGREYGQLIAVSVNIEMFLADSISRRTDLNTRVRKVKVLSSMLLIEPRKDRIEFKHSGPFPVLGLVSYSSLGRTYLTGVLEVHPTVWPRGHTTVTTNYTTVHYYSFLAVTLGKRNPVRQTRFF